MGVLPDAFASSNGTLLTTVALAVVVGLLLSRLFKLEIDPREPPVVYPTVPLIGHIIGMVRNGPLYLKTFGQKYSHPIITLPVFTSRTYLVLSPDLASQVQRASSTLDFVQLAVEALPRMTGISKETKQIVDDPKSKEEGRERMVTQVIHGLMAPMLSPGKIGDIADVQLRHFTDFLNAIPNGHEAELFRFLSREITRASMVTFYGPNNPFALHPELVEEFWNWEGGIVGYMMGIFPKWTARKAHHGLENCVKAFIEYMQHNRHSQAYELLRRRQQFHQDEGITLEEQARLEIPMCLGINVNAGITVLWMMNHIFSRPALLAEVREEVQSNALVKPDLISFTALRDKCPLINSIYKESMRIAAPMTSGRYVVADTLVADTWLLRKGTVVQIAGPALHTNKEIWGADAETFNPRRFVYNWNGTRSSEDGSIVDGKANQVPSAAYRSFGGGSSLCPGRHFAQMEIVSLAALLVMGFDLEAPSGQDRVCWNPPMDDKRFPIAVIKPLKDLNVKFTRRSGTEDVQWKLEY